MEQRLCLSTVSPIRQKSDGIGIADWLASSVPAVRVQVSAAVPRYGRGADRDFAPRPQRISGAGTTSATSGVGQGRKEKGPGRQGYFTSGQPPGADPLRRSGRLSMTSSIIAR